MTLENLFKGLESMRPEIVVILGNFISAENNETQPLDKLKLHFDNILNILDKI